MKAYNNNKLSLTEILGS